MKNEYVKISECGKYGAKAYGNGSPGGELWWPINEPFAEMVGEMWDIDNFEIAIDAFEEEMRELCAVFGVE